MSDELDSDAALKACAEMRDILDRIWEEDEMGWIQEDGCRESECVKCGAILPHGGHAQDCLQGIIHHALSSDCGKGYIKASELGPTIALLRELHEDTDPEYAPTTERELAKEITRLEHLLKGGS